MTISIAMCTYNGARYLDTQLRSFATQTRCPDELVICDDGSSDDTVRIVTEFAETAPFTVRIYKNGATLGYAKNFEQAIRLCEGDLIALSDQDDIWYPSKLATLSSAMQDEVIGGAFSDGDLMTSTLCSTGQTLWGNLRFTAREQDDFRRGRGAEALLRRDIVTGMTLVFRATLRSVLLPVPQSWPHDSWLALMLVAHSSILPISTCLVGYRTHVAQHTGAPQTRMDKFKCLRKQGVASFLSRSRTNNLAEYEKAARQFEELTDHLQKAQPSGLLLTHARAKAIHARSAIATLNQPRIRRITRVVAKTVGYRRYSSPAWQNMIRDLVL